MSAPDTLELTGDFALAFYSTDGSAYTAFADIEDAEPFKITVPEVKRTALTDTANKSQAGTPDYGDASVSLGYNKTLVTTILGWIAGKTTNYFKVVLNDGTTANTIVSGTPTAGSGSTFIYQGWIKEFDATGTLSKDKKAMHKVTIKLTGPVAYTAGT